MNFLSSPMWVIWLKIQNNIKQSTLFFKNKVYQNNQVGWGGPGGLVTPKIKQLKFWRKPSFYPAFYFISVIVFTFLFIFYFLFNYHWKMSILIVVCIYSFLFISCYLTLTNKLTKISIFVYLEAATGRSSTN